MDDRYCINLLVCIDHNYIDAKDKSSHAVRQPPYDDCKHNSNCDVNPQPNTRVNGPLGGRNSRTHRSVTRVLVVRSVEWQNLKKDTPDLISKLSTNFIHKNSFSGLERSKTIPKANER